MRVAQGDSCGLHDVNIRHFERGGLGEDRDVPVVRGCRAGVENLVQIVKCPVSWRECVEAGQSAVIGLFFEPSPQLVDQDLALLIGQLQRLLPVQPCLSECVLPANEIFKAQHEREGVIQLRGALVEH